MNASLKRVTPLILMKVIWACAENAYLTVIVMIINIATTLIVFLKKHQIKVVSIIMNASLKGVTPLILMKVIWACADNLLRLLK